LIDSYAEGLIDKQEFQPRIERSKDRLRKLEQTLQALADQETRQRELRLVITRLEEFAKRVTASLEQADWTGQRELIRTLVKRVEIGPEAVKIVFRVEPDTPSLPGTHLESDSLPDCRRRDYPALRSPPLSGRDLALQTASSFEHRLNQAQHSSIGYPLCPSVRSFL
jgi:site-specific DNA recombinase